MDRLVDTALIHVDEAGRVTAWDEGAVRLFGWSSEEASGQTLTGLLGIDDDSALQQRTNEGAPVTLETWAPTRDRRRIAVALTAIPASATSGRSPYLLVAVSRQEVHDSDEPARRLAAIVESSDDAIISKDLNGIVTSWNAAAERIFGYTAEEMIGASIRTIIPEDRQSEEDRTLATIRRGDRVDHFETVRRSKTGRLINISLTVSPVRAADGRILGASKVARDITQLKAAEAERHRLLENAQDASRLKDEFLASLSHELRTPLNAILGYARIVRSGLIGPDKRDKAIETIERNANALARIVEDVLDVSRIISGKMRLNVQPVDLADVVQASIDAVAPGADARGIRLETVLDPLPHPISGDPDRLQQVLWNLLSNAVKFTNRGGRVQVRLARVDSHVEVVVSDTGVGIAPEFLPHLFERFRQADASTTRERGGLGLGLAIARQLVEMHGGTIDVASGGRDLGSTFRVKLPVMIVHSVRDEGPRVHPRSDRRKPDPVAHDLRSVRVLVVDDDRDALSLVEDVLTAAGAQVRTAHSAKEALAALDAEAPNVLVADLGMPHMDGFELIARVRSHDNPDVRDVPAAALTAYARSDDRMKALRAGFHIHLAKPIEPDELVTTVDALARRFGSRQSTSAVG
jgi:PAS domain S-box-containing protein